MEFTEKHLQAQYQKYLDQPWDNYGDGPWIYEAWKKMYLAKRTASKN